MTPATGVQWLLVPAPVPTRHVERYWDATATCPHGRTRHLVVAPAPTAVVGQIADLSAMHAHEWGCDCPYAELVMRERRDDARS